MKPSRAVVSSRALLARVPWSEVAVVMGAYLALSILISWPLAANIGSDIAGGGAGGDQSGYVWDFWNNATHGLKLWGTDVQTAVGAPFGRESPASVNTTLFATLGPAWIVASIWSPVVAYNVTVLLALTLSASAMYLLVRWVGAGRTPAAWAGAAFMVFPYEILRAHIHIPLTHIWCLPIVVLVTLRWLERPGARRAAFMGLGLLACWLTTPYYGTMGGLIVAVGVVIGAVRVLRGRGARAMATRVAEATAAVLALVIVPLGILFTLASGAIDDSLHRDRGNLLLFGARLSDYLVPPVDSTFFRGLFGPTRWSELGSVGGERMAFVGYVTLVLAVIGVGAVIGRRRREGRQWLVVLLGLFSVPLLVLFSLASPTSVFGREMDMPSAYLFDVLPYMQSYARFSAAVMTFLLVLGAVGFSLLLKRRSQVFCVALASSIFVLSALELPRGAPAGRVIASDVPLRVEGRTADAVPTWRWLARNEPDAIVYEMPGQPNEYVERFFMYGQMVHGHRIVNGSLSAAQIGYDIMRANGDPEWPGVARRLATLGISLVTVNPWAYAMVGAPAPDVHNPPEGFTLVTTFDDGSGIWRVTAPPDDAIALPRVEGWWNPERLGDTVWQWMTDRARTTLVAREAGRYRITLEVSGLRAHEGDRYGMEMVGPDGRTLGRHTVGTKRDAAFTLDLPAGRTDVWLVASGHPPRHVAAGDPRLVTLSISGWQFERIGPAEMRP